MAGLRYETNLGFVLKLTQAIRAENLPLQGLSLPLCHLVVDGMLRKNVGGDMTPCPHIGYLGHLQDSLVLSKSKSINQGGGESTHVHACMHDTRMHARTVAQAGLELTKLQSMTRNSLSSCLFVLSASITDVLHNAWLYAVGGVTGDLRLPLYQLGYPRVYTKKTFEI